MADDPKVPNDKAEEETRTKHDRLEDLDLDDEGAKKVKAGTSDPQEGGQIRRGGY